MYAGALTWPIVKSVTLETADAITEAWPIETALLLDAADSERRGGTGQEVDWARAAALRAGARRRARRRADAREREARDFRGQPVHGVDVSSGVEAAQGLKDANKVARFWRTHRKRDVGSERM